MVVAVLASIREKALNGKRLGRDEGRWLLTEAPLLELGALANEVRFARIPDKVVTFVIDSNPNYTNVCVTDCQFCAFYRKTGGPSAWLEVHREAHRRGFKSTATMMYGHVEQPDDLLDHLDAIRELQDERGGFTAFVPWSFKPGHTLLEKWIKQVKGPNSYLRILGCARLYLDNFLHVQASWFSEGKQTGQIALHFGADDWGGTLFEENVHKAADYVNTITVEEITALIRETGFTPAQRTTTYEILRTW